MSFFLLDVERIDQCDEAMTLQVREEDPREFERVKDSVRKLAVQGPPQEAFVEFGVVCQQWAVTRKLQELVHDLIDRFCRFEVERSNPCKGRDEFRETCPFLQAAELFKSFDLLAPTYLDGANLDDLIGSLIEACCFEIEEDEFLFVFQVIPFYLK